MKPLVLIILDGWGLAPPNKGNAVTLAKTPTMDYLSKNYPYATLCASGECVGLPKGQDGNSEAGHLNLGAGRIVKSDDVIINEEIANGEFFNKEIFFGAARHTKKYKSKIHLMGLITEEQSAHSSPEHWLAMLKFLDENHIDDVYLHLFTDGRDSPQHAAVEIIKRFEKKVKYNHHQNNLKIHVATVSGRFYAMDRTKNWSRIKKVYQAMVLGEGLKAETAAEAIVRGYNRQETDEFITPTVIVKEGGKPVATIDNNDVVIFMNLRSDRAREITKAFVQKDFNAKNPNSFERKKWPKNLYFVALTDFGPDLDDVKTVYPSRIIINSLPFALKNFKQVYISETEKYAHVTFFFNGGYDHAVVGEERINIPSPKVKNYAEVPEMSLPKVVETISEKLKTDNYDFIMVNFCNTDMIGHTGDLQAGIRAVEIVDFYLAKAINVVKEKNGIALVTADHGNVEEMINLKTGEVDTQHSINPVPFILVSDEHKNKKLRYNGILADVAPTILDLFNVEKPKEMTGQTLIAT